jgi:uncharacterized protein
MACSTAIGIGPQPALLGWRCPVLHEPFADEDEGHHILGLLTSNRRRTRARVRELRTDLGEANSTTAADTGAHGWCEGFFAGVDLRARVWESRLGADSQLTELLGPIMALAVEEGVFATDADFAPLSEQEYDDCLGQLPVAVGAVARYWRESPPTAEELASASTAGADGDGPRRRRGGRWVH